MEAYRLKKSPRATETENGTVLYVNYISTKMGKKKAP